MHVHVGSQELNFCAICFSLLVLVVDYVKKFSFSWENSPPAAVVYSGTNDEVFLYCLSHIAQLILDDPTLVVLAVVSGTNCATLLVSATLNRGDLF